MNGTVNYREPILFNPGGPGRSGVEGILEFDVLSIDPRGMITPDFRIRFAVPDFWNEIGIANSTPAISFLNTDVESAVFDFGPHATDPTATPNVLPSRWVNFQPTGRLAKDRDTAGV